MKTYLRNKLGSIVATIATIACAISNENPARADSGVSGYSGKAFDPNAAFCFAANAGWAQNNCPFTYLWAIYPVVSGYTTGPTIAINVNANTLTSCRIDITAPAPGGAIYAFQSGTHTPSTNGVSDVLIGGVPFGDHYSPEIVCAVPPDGQIRGVTFD